MPERGSVAIQVEKILRNRPQATPLRPCAATPGVAVMMMTKHEVLTRQRTDKDNGTNDAVGGGDRHAQDCGAHDGRGGGKLDTPAANVVHVGHVGANRAHHLVAKRVAVWGEGVSPFNKKQPQRTRQVPRKSRQ